MVLCWFRRAFSSRISLSKITQINQNLIFDAHKVTCQGLMGYFNSFCIAMEGFYCFIAPFQIDLGIVGGFAIFTLILGIYSGDFFEAISSISVHRSGI